MSIGIVCDLCGIPVSSTETCNAFRMWNGVRCAEIEQVGLNSLTFDENFYVCDECLDKVCDSMTKLKKVEQ